MRSTKLDLQNVPLKLGLKPPSTSISTKGAVRTTPEAGTCALGFWAVGCALGSLIVADLGYGSREEGGCIPLIEIF